MSTSKLYLCRLCMSTELLTDLYKVDNDFSLVEKTFYCIDIKMFPEDGLPSLICELCEQNINKFYNFKQSCLKVDTKLRSVNITNTTDTKINIHRQNAKMDEQQLTNRYDNNIDSLHFWFTDNTKFNCNNETQETRHSNIFTDQSKNNSNTMKSVNLSNNKSDKVFQCEHCGRIFTNKTVLKNHLGSHTDIKLFSCKICMKKFTRAEHKIVHMRIHNGIRPYICEICGKASTKRQDLIRHLRIHSDEKKYKCPRCDRRFKRSSDVHSHMRTHTGARPYSCNVCSKTYTSHSGYSKHRKKYCKKETISNPTK